VKPNNDIFLFKFFRDSEQFWNLFWKILSLNQNTLRGFFTELELIGLGFRIKKITNTLYRFFWGHANYVYLFVPNSVLVEYSHDERLIFFFSIDIEAVNQIVSYLLLLRKLSVYRVTGFVRPGKIIRLNSGKQR
jgi:ribosomal protein L6P/L9E